VIEDLDLQTAVAEEYMVLADVLASVDESDWDKPSMCAGWRVREVVAHMTMPARYDEQAFMLELQARNFDFGRLSNEIAALDAQLARAELVANLRSEVLHHWAPPGGGYHGALNHVVIHGLDATVPLGVQRRPVDETMRIVLDDLTEDGANVHFCTDFTGRRLETTDLDWAYGDGEDLRGAAGDLALLLCGRSIPPERLEGKPL
jgi:uncharacterized protein (TIGR03083 family)